MFHVEQMEKDIHCPLCGSRESKLERAVVDHMVSKEKFSLRSCRDCELLRTDPRPNEKEIGRYYDSPSYLSHTEQGVSFFSKLYNVLRAYNSMSKVRTLESVVQKKPNISKLLDVGCGIGVFLEHAKHRKWDVFGVELNEKARKVAEKRLKTSIFQKLDDVKTELKFDAISLWHVLEHLPEPNKVLEKLYGHAAPGAALILGLPNRQSHDAAHYKEFWAAYDVPIHFWHFTKRDIEGIAKNTGWLVETIKPMRLDAFYVSLLSESYKTGRKRWASALFRGLYSNLKGGQLNTSSLIYVLRKQG